MRRFLPCALLLTLTLILTACGNPSTPPPYKVTPTPMARLAPVTLTLPVFAPTATPNVPAGWQTYNLREGLYQVALPSDWVHHASGVHPSGEVFIEEFAHLTEVRDLSIFDFALVTDNTFDYTVTTLERRLTAEADDLTWVQRPRASGNETEYIYRQSGQYRDCPSITYGKFLVAGKRILHLSFIFCNLDGSDSYLGDFVRQTYDSLEHIQPRP